MPAISVILPTRNRHDLLPRALQSLAAQSYEDFEILLVDDNDAAQRVALQPPLAPLITASRLHLIENDRPLNAARARNLGLDQAQGEWIAFLDDDDAYHPDKLRKQLAMGKESGLKVGTCGMRYLMPGRRSVRQCKVNRFEGDDILLSASPGTGFVFHRRGGVRFREDLLTIEDAHYFLSLVRESGHQPVFNVPEPLYDVHVHSHARVNANVDGLLAAATIIHEELAVDYGPAAARQYWLRANLSFYKKRKGDVRRFVRYAIAVLVQSRCRRWRTVINAILYKIPATRPLVIN